jgi:glycerophosphodiester phosphodiesterase
LEAFTETVPFQSLPRNQVPEWAGAYINYKGLKKLVKAAAEKARNGETVDPAGGLP